MKKILLLSLLLVVSFYSCKKEIEKDPETPSLKFEDFHGKWERTFDAAGNEHTAKYEISSNEISFELVGVNGFGEYVMNKVSYDDSENKWIGKTDSDLYYVIFFKGVLNNKLTFYKEKVDSETDANNLEKPADDSLDNYGWLTYEKK